MAQVAAPRPRTTDCGRCANTGGRPIRPVVAYCGIVNNQPEMTKLPEATVTGEKGPRVADRANQVVGVQSTARE